MTDNAEEVTRKRMLSKDMDNNAYRDLKDVLSTYSGRAVLSAVLDECGLYAAIPTDEHKTFRALGKRDIGLWLRDKILTTGNKYVMLMETESRKREEYIKN